MSWVSQFMRLTSLRPYLMCPHISDHQMFLIPCGVRGCHRARVGWPVGHVRCRLSLPSALLWVSTGPSPLGLALPSLSCHGLFAHLPHHWVGGPLLISGTPAQGLPGQNTHLSCVCPHLLSPVSVGNERTSLTCDCA